MDNFLLYLLKVSAGTTLLYLSYLLFFSRDTFYRRNRVLLIITLLLPVLLPAIRIPVISESPVQPGPIAGIENIIYSGVTSEPVAPVAASHFDYRILLAWVYFVIAGLVLLRAMISILSTFSIIRKGKALSGGIPKVIISVAEVPPFSFFPYVVIPSKNYDTGNYRDILDHELAHLRQGHTFDLLLCELFIAMQWFNPFVWLIKRSVVLNHEYLADRASLSDKNPKEYQYRLLNSYGEFSKVSLAHNFNSLIKKRIIMINRRPTRKYAMLKNMLVLPVVALLAYAFVTPEYRTSGSGNDLLTVTMAPPITQKDVKGVVLNEEGKPIAGARVDCYGTIGEARGTTTGNDGRFTLYYVQEDASLSFSANGYKGQSIKAVFDSEMTVRLAKDPDFKEPQVMFASRDGVPLTNPITVLDGVITNEPAAVINARIKNELGTIVNLSPKDATAKYGEAGKNGATEIYTKKKAAELGMKIPFRRTGPDDFPTFMGKYHLAFNDWVIENVRYPSEASSKGIQGRVSATYTIEADGSLGKITLLGNPDPLLGDAVVKTIQASPRWEPAKNPEASGPITGTVSVKFELPDKVSPDDAFVMVEEMPMYPGGDAALLNFIKTNTVYPEAAKQEKIEGRVIIRFIVTKNGDAEEPMILKGVNPLLDAEAIRVVKMLKGFKPGYQGGKPVDVYYMVPVSFSLAPAETPK